MKLNKVLTGSALAALVAAGASAAPAAFAGTRPHWVGGAVYVNAAPSVHYPRTQAPAQVTGSHRNLYAAPGAVPMQPLPTHQAAQYYGSPVAHYYEPHAQRAPWQRRHRLH